MAKGDPQIPRVTSYEQLPAALEAQLGPHRVDYESFVAVNLPSEELEALQEEAWRLGLSVTLGSESTMQLPWHSVDSEGLARFPSNLPSSIKPQPLPGAYLVQFAYPILDEWVAELEACGVKPIAYFQHRTYLVRTTSVEAVTSCSVAPYLRTVDSWYTTDRVDAALLARSGTFSVWLQYQDGSDLAEKADGLSIGVAVDETYRSEVDRVSYLRATVDAEQLSALLSGDSDLLSASLAGEAVLSDERQGQIVAGNHNGVSVTGPGYRNWLNSRGLLGSSNQQIVAVMDTGYDDGTAPSSTVTHHPDLESPDRLDGLKRYSGYGTTGWDPFGHGTMVAGIIAGDGTLGYGTGGQDSGGYLYGSGIAPKSQIYAAKFEPALLDVPATQETALSDARNYSGGLGANRAFIANESWNQRDESNNSTYVPINSYQYMARFFDNRVRDANTKLSGDQPMTIVFSSGNFANNCNNLIWDTVAAPATAKNVITVGASESYRPTPTPPLSCLPCTDGVFGRPPNLNATHVSRIAAFSSRGRFFQPYPASELAHATRIKPDLVAPAVRVFSTVPYAHNYPADGFVGCTDFYPSLPSDYHTYGSGTSFAAPVVSGVAALKRKWFLDKGTDPAPSLLKASLVATADSLGGLAGNDHRPSPRYGWGRVNLNRATDSTVRFYVNESAGLAISTGQTRSWTRSVGAGSKPIYIVLAWSDPPTAVDGNSQAALVNDLSLKVGGGTWRGNFFNENITGVDNGYSYQFTLGVGANDTINNVEAVFIPAGTYSTGQSITLEVSGANVPQGPQLFSLYAYNLQ